MQKALINGSVLRWARERASLPTDVVATKLNQKPETILAWEAGSENPTFKQAQTLASVTHVPFGYLFLPRPPEDALQIPDLRTVGSEPPEHLDVNFRDLLSDVLFRHGWFVDLLKIEGADVLPFVGSFNIKSGAAAVANDIRKHLRASVDGGRSVRTSDEHLMALMTQAEDAGIWVMRSSIVGNNTHRPLSVRQFRGFAICDPLAPLVFINGRDATAAQIFTLVHELAHIWIGESGISNAPVTKADSDVGRAAETFCNRVAAEFLVPQDAFNREWDDDKSAASNYNRLASRFKVSRVVIARRAHDLGKVARPAFTAFAMAEEEAWDSEEGGSGGNLYNTLPIRYGRRFTREVTHRAMAGQVLLRDAASLLNIKPASVVRYSRTGRL